MTLKTSQRLNIKPTYTRKECAAILTGTWTLDPPLQSIFAAGRKLLVIIWYCAAQAAAAWRGKGTPEETLPTSRRYPCQRHFHDPTLNKAFTPSKPPSISVWPLRGGVSGILGRKLQILQPEPHQNPLSRREHPEARQKQASASALPPQTAQISCKTKYSKKQ